MNYDEACRVEFGPGKETGLDPAILQELPEGCKIVSTDNHGVSFWAKTGRLDVLLNDGTLQSFFIKVLSKDQGKSMVEAEFESMRAIYNVLPNFVPRPVAWGAFSAIPETYFFLCEFRDMSDEMPDPRTFGALLSALHQKSVSPTGKFGFHTTTYAGNLPQHVEWEDSWETFFAKSMKKALDLEIERKGPSEELDVLSQALFERVIPRLLRPLESGGRSVKPSLVHGDLWYANSGIDVDSGQTLVFDACCFFAHNECGYMTWPLSFNYDSEADYFRRQDEFGQWMPACNRFGAEYIAAYNTFLNVSPPEEDFEGRLNLYRLRFDTHVSALFTDSDTLRTQVLDVMRALVEKYGQDGKMPVPPE